MAIDPTGLWTELIASAVGVLLGGVGALALARWRLNRQTAEQRKRSREHLRAVLDWLELELQENHELMEELRQVFNREQADRADVLRWAASIGQSLALEAHAEVVRAGHHRRLPAEVERQLFRAHQATTSLRNALRQAEPAVAFYVDCCGEVDAVQRLVADLEERIEKGLEEVAHSRDLIEGLDGRTSGIAAADGDGWAADRADAGAKT